MKTIFFNENEVSRSWYVIDAAGKPLGRVAAKAAAMEAEVKEAFSDENLEEKQDKKDIAIADLTDRLKRSMAEFDNFRKRSEKEKATMFDMGVGSIAEKILPVVDNFERAMTVEQTDGEAFQKGVEMIFTQLREVMEKHGLENIEAEGAPFDPNIHQAVMRVENPDVEDGTITQVLQKGYQAKGRVIRPAMVQVAGN